MGYAWCECRGKILERLHEIHNVKFASLADFQISGCIRLGWETESITHAHHSYEFVDFKLSISIHIELRHELYQLF